MDPAPEPGDAKHLGLPPSPMTSEHPGPPPRHRRLRNRQLAAITSGFVGALALATSFYNVYLQRRQIEAQVWPHLEWTFTNSKANEFSFNLTNAGVGPARIGGVKVTIDGKSAKDWHEAFDLLAANDPALAKLLKEPDLRSETSTVSGRVLGAGVALPVIAFHSAPVDGSAADLSPLVDVYKHLRLEICYCSTLDDCELMRARKTVSKCALEPPLFDD